MASDINGRDSFFLRPFSTMALHRPSSRFGAHIDTWVTPKVKRGERAGGPHLGVPGPRFQFCRDSCSLKSPSSHRPLAKGTRSMLVPTFSTSWEGCGQKKVRSGRGCLATSSGAQIAHQMAYLLALPATPGLPA